MALLRGIEHGHIAIGTAAAALPHPRAHSPRYPSGTPVHGALGALGQKAAGGSDPSAPSLRIGSIEASSQVLLRHRRSRSQHNASFTPPGLQQISPPANLWLSRPHPRRVHARNLCEHPQGLATGSWGPQPRGRSTGQWRSRPRLAQAADQWAGNGDNARQGYNSMSRQTERTRMANGAGSSSSGLWNGQPRASGDHSSHGAGVVLEDRDGGERALVDAWSGSGSEGYASSSGEDDILLRRRDKLDDMTANKLLTQIGLALLIPLGGLAVFLMACFIRAQPRGYRAVMQFPQACGVNVGTPVRVRGMEIGSVVEMRPSIERVDAIVEIKDEANVLPKDSAYVANQSGLVGEPLIDVTPKLPVAAHRYSPRDVEACRREGIIVCDGDRIEGKEGVSMDELVGLWVRLNREGDLERQKRGWS